MTDAGAYSDPEARLDQNDAIDSALNGAFTLHTRNSCVESIARSTLIFLRKRIF